MTSISTGINDERSATGWVSQMLTSVPVEALSTSGELEKELWSLLEYYLIDDVAEMLFSRQKITDKKLLKKLVHDFQSYIHQARNFYDYARNSDYRSAPLLFYYAFMNLSKALLILQDYKLHDKEFHHGLSRVVKVGGLDKLSIKSQSISQPDRVSIFREMYKRRFGVYLPPEKHIKIIDLLGYVSEIVSEYRKTTGRKSRISDVKYVVMMDKRRKVSWVKLAIFEADKMLKHKSHLKSFLKEFSEVKITNTTRQHVFALSPYGANYFKYFESNKEFPFFGSNDAVDTMSGDALLNKVFHGLAQAEVYDTTSGFQLVEPVELYKNSDNRKSGKAQMDELTAIYMIMYHLSEIVRYEPAYIDRLLSSDTKDGWMLRSFIHSSPYTFLLRMLSSIAQTNFFLSRR